MKKQIFLYGSLLFVAAALSSCTDNNPAPAANTAQAMSNEDLIKKGEYLVTTIGCNDCHSPKRMGERGPEVIPELMLSGYPGDRPVPKASADALKNGWGLLNSDFTSFVGPWGESFAGNLTSDQTGIGNWTEEQFKKALTQGKFKGIDGSRMLLPPMPWTNWANMKDEDIKAIFQYLKSTPPVRNIVPAPIPPDGLFADQ
jgi:mono/diheme cytochrome c family protein